MTGDRSPDAASSPETPTVASALVDRLLADGIDTVFGIPGKQTLPLNRALDRRNARFVVARHETAVTHQAWGYAETRPPGEMAATVVVPGPGDMNAMNGLKNALNDAVPLLHLAVETEHDVRGGDGIHETPPETYDTVVKENVLVETAQGVIPAIARAIRTAREHPQGPVRVGIPKDFLAESVPQAAVGDLPVPEPDRPDPDAVADAADRLAAAVNPVILAGGGVRRSGASTALVALAERLDAPVVTTYKGKGTIPEDHPLSAGVLCGGASTELTELLASADVGLAVGSDLDAVATRHFSVPLPDELVHVTLGVDDIGVGYDPTVGIVADAGATIAAIGDRLPEAPSEHDANGVERARSVRSADRERFDRLIEEARGDDPMPSIEALRAIREALPRETILTADAGGSRLWTLVSVPAFGPDRYVNPGSWATMGTALPSAIGAKLANPDAPVAAIVGDGGLLMCVHELHTLAAENVDVTVLALNNDDYAIISDEASRSYGFRDGRYGWSDAHLDLSAIAEGMGVNARRITDADAIPAAVTDALADDGPNLIEIVTDPAEPQASEWMRR
ncbi:acetolactate synthase, large subunit [Halopenitus malekzadehii]|uniref:Acetolactate synthase, large subunit n=1 Tax=Halopenitus malekzadehii TaxID=1267564 RepID=A0A1H6JFU6_9EURY|nr:thiamine pyrophosphate-binding protein [Halopenitus malekzadehii]SEH57962.1 acetolactate synthase, large subunit [Halopenitus malekzadehii]